jgi:hypothetical protein
MKSVRTGWLPGVLLCVLLAGCLAPPRAEFVDVASPLHSATIAVVSADEEKVRLRISGPDEPVFLALVEPRVIEDGLYLFPSYISRPMHSEQVEVPVVELDLPARWRNHIYWVEGEEVSPWYHILRPRVQRIERRHLELPPPSPQGGDGNPNS